MLCMRQPIFNHSIMPTPVLKIVVCQHCFYKCQLIVLKSRTYKLWSTIGKGAALSQRKVYVFLWTVQPTLSTTYATQIHATLISEYMILGKDDAHYNIFL